MSSLPSWDSIPGTGPAPAGPVDPVPSTNGYPVPSPGRSRRLELADDQKINAFGTAYANFMQVVTLDHFDEGTAFVDSTLPKWMGGRGGSYEENLRLVRAQIDQGNEDHEAASWVGFGGGMFVPIGWLSRGKKGVDAARATTGLGRIAAEGATLGAIQGFGASEGERYFDFDRVRDAAVGGVFGAAGGYLLGGLVIPAGSYGLTKAAALFSRGKPASVDFKFKLGEQITPEATVAEDLTSLRNTNAKRTRAVKDKPEVTPGATKAATKPVRTNPLTGQADDVLEEGALFTAREATDAASSPVTIKEAMFARIAALDPATATIAAKKFASARATGQLTKDPHFRSILGIDLDNLTDDVEGATQAAVLLEEFSEALLERAGQGKTTVAAMEAAVRRQYGGQITETEIDKLVSKVTETRGSANIGSTIMAISGIQFARAAQEIMPRVLKGEEGARKELVDRLTSAIRISSKGRLLVSEAGRNLGMLSKSRNPVFTEVTPEGIQVEAAAAIKARVEASLTKLGDNELVELLSRIKDLSKLEEVADILSDLNSAEQLAWYWKARNTAGLWLKSNTLTPMSGVINTVGFILHDVFRNTWARDFARHVASKAGNVDDALALKFQGEVLKAVRWQAHGAGINAALQRVKWEWLESALKVEKVAGGSAVNRIAAAKAKMLSSGYSPPALREVDFEQTLGVQDFSAFDAKLASRADQGGAFGALVSGLERTAATAFQVVNETATSTGRIVSGVLDDWGRSYVKVREVYAQSAAFATREAIDAGLNEKEMVQYIQKRTAELAEMPPSDILAEVERKLIDDQDLGDVDRMLLRRDYDADAEAERVLFIDGPQTQAGRVVAASASLLDKAAGGWALPGILMTYIRTPTRIFERGLSSYTPWAAKADEVRTILNRAAMPNATQAERLAGAVEQARMELGTMVIGLGMVGGAMGAVNVTNGGWSNSRNLTGEPANRLNLPGGGYVEIGRLDPISLTLALGAAMGQAWKAFKEDGDAYGRDAALQAAMQTGYLAIRESILEKSYLTGVRDLMKSAFAQDEEGAGNGYTKMLGSAVSRLVPLSGVTRQVQETYAGDAQEALTFMDRLFKTIPGMGGYLPSKVDPIGNTVEGRVMGLAAGTTADSDQLTKDMAALGVNITNLRKADPSGFDLTSEELSELRYIRAHEATNGDGLTMREALADLLADPEFTSLPSRDQKQTWVVDVMKEFNAPARELFEERNQEYLSNRIAGRSLQDYINEGMSRPDAEAGAAEDVAAEGLPAATRF